ncbi:hypothetical protein [Planosporangium mesophilum]|uniref:hypothetical protein n=1 Tax=Planosporangium mesophilum TaxID=689768 RepID=UPI00194F84E1|nr:hypothetical protein [Planosporangium mesophilum]
MRRDDGAASARLRLHEPRSVTANAVLFRLALTVAIGRFAGLSRRRPGVGL